MHRKCNNFEAGTGIFIGYSIQRLANTKIIIIKEYSSKYLKIRTLDYFLVFQKFKNIFKMRTFTAFLLIK